MFAKTALTSMAVFLGIYLLLGALETLGVGLDRPLPVGDDISQRIVARFEVEEEKYFTWGRWIDLTTALGFAGLLLATPSLRVSFRTRALLTSGAALAIAGDMIDLSKLTGFELARFGLDHGLPETFAAGNVFKSAINTTSTYVWVSGLIIVAIGLMVLMGESRRGRLRTSSGVFAAGLLGMAVSGPFLGSPYFETAVTVMGLAAIVWAFAAMSLLDGDPAADGE
jgi:hypothetical protein